MSGALRLLWAGVFAAVLGGTAWAGGAGSVSGEFLNIAASTRAAAMGEAYTGLADDVGALYHNPAGIASIADMSFHYLHAFWLESIGYDYMAGVFPMGKFGCAGVSLTRLYMEATRITEGPMGEPVYQDDFAASDSSFALSYAYRVEEAVALGATVRVISQDLDAESDSAAAFDLGVKVRTPIPRLSTGAVVCNMGSKLDEASMPLTMKIGAAYSLQPVQGIAALIGRRAAVDLPVLAADLNFPVSPQEASFIRARLGVEYAVGLDESQAAALRLGYKIGEEGAGSMSGITAGMGYRMAISSFAPSIDYALGHFGDLGMTHRLAFTTSFMRPQKAEVAPVEEGVPADVEGQALLSWPSYSNPGVTGYNVYMGESKEGKFRMVNVEGPVKATSILANGLAAGKEYFFFVTALEDGGPFAEGRPFFERKVTAEALP